MKKALAVLLAILMVSSTVAVSAANDDTQVTSKSPELTISNAQSYEAFLSEHASDARPSEKYDVDITQYVATECTAEIRENYNGKTSNSLYISEDGSVTFTVNVAKAGLYGLKLDFYAENSRGASIEREILINGELQHDGAESVIFKRIYIDDPNGVGKQDTAGNDIRPSQIEYAVWQNDYFVRDTDFYISGMLFSFKEGVNTITFNNKSEPITVANLSVCNQEETSAYEDVKNNYESNGYKQADADTIIINAENANFKSDTVLYPIVDRTTSSTIPYESGVNKLNSIGGYRWNKAGQFLTWNFEVPKDGLYTIYIKARQNVTRGVVSNRAIYIDNEIPFAEFEDYDFNYDKNWQLIRLGTDDEAYQIYLTAGEHELKMEATLGETSEIIQNVEGLLTELNEIYTTIMTITGSKPDAMREYYLEELIPNEIERMGGIAKELQSVIDWYADYTNGSGQSVATLNSLIRQLEKLNKKPDMIAKNLDYFKSNIGSLASWLITAQEQPLELDYIAFVSNGETEEDLPIANASFFEKIAFNIAQFLSSFIDDYANIGSSSAGNKENTTIKVWTSTGRDQAQAMRKIIDSTFTADKNINVTLELVNASALLPATVAGIGPDVALNMASTEAINYAIRNAVIDLTRFPDFDEVASRFLPERMVSLTFDGKSYALPETQSFEVLFYRKDILSEFELEIPQTWEDVISVITVLQKNNMSFALPVTANTYYLMLFQNGGHLYNDNGKTSALDSEIGLSTFKQWVNYYINYDLPKEYNFLDRFRTGEYPLIIGDFSNFNSLTVSAPEIRGLWSFTLLPGTLKEDGTIDRSMTVSGLDCFILKNSKHYDEAWEFLKWWTGADAQTDYGTEMESILGASARYATANLEAFERIPWSNEFYKVLKEQMQWGRGVEEVPGSYFTARHLNNAFREVAISSNDIKDTLFDYVYTINQELTSKRKEFGLETE